MAQRSAFEQAAFWAVLGAALLWPFVARADRQVAGQQLLLSSALFLLALGFELAERSPAAASPTQRGGQHRPALLGRALWGDGSSLGARGGAASG